MTAIPDPDREIIEQFQEQRRQFQPLWRRTVGLIFFPGFILFLIGGQLDFRALVIPGIGLCVVGAVKAALLVFRYRPCPACGRIQTPRVSYPYRTCEGCGVRLSVGAKDSI